MINLRFEKKRRFFNKFIHDQSFPMNHMILIFDIFSLPFGYLPTYSPCSGPILFCLFESKTHVA
ncbi:hypothetical protein PATA110615_22850 [Paenibacillus taichungensis]